MIFLAFSKKRKVFATFYQKICEKIICTIKIYSKMHFSIDFSVNFRCDRLLIFKLKKIYKK